MEDWNEDINQRSAIELQEESDRNEEEEIEPLVSRIAHTAAIKALNTAIEWSKQNAVHISDLMVLKMIHEKAVITKLS